MSDTVIRVENLGKKYIISHQQDGKASYKTLREAVTDSIKSIGSRVIETKKNISSPNREEFWALNDVSFEIKQGDRVGIIGRNGAGKSTLLKVLSRITEPTNGRISIKGRVASLLEVGTGFHPELTGRENIYLNGAILGMSKVEIKKKFDEIVEFAEVEKFLDTPVKRYSSGMYVRLAFAVAAHLEPEILIVDEVLAVGDAQFQKKCLGKMQDVSESEGRTVLFVSHNMDAIQRLCSHCIMLERGKLIAKGDTASVLVSYLSSNSDQSLPNRWIDLSQAKRMGTGDARFVAIQYSSLNEAAGFQPYSNGYLEFILDIWSDSDREVRSLAVIFYTQSGTKILNADIILQQEIVNLKKGNTLVKFSIENLCLQPKVYILGLWLAKRDRTSPADALDYAESAFEIEVIDLESQGRGVAASDSGFVTCKFHISEVV